MDLWRILDCGQLSSLIHESCGTQCAICFPRLFRESPWVSSSFDICINAEFLGLDIERFYGQRKLLAQRVPILQPRPQANGSAKVIPQVPSPLRGQGQMLSRARAFSDPPSTPSTPGGSTPFDSETDTDNEQELQHTCVNEGTTVSKLSHHDLRNRYFRRDTIVLHHLDIFRCVYLTC
jgi:hypothetical protein